MNSTTNLIPITINLRGKEYQGHCTDDDAFFLASFYYNQREKELSDAGKEQDAFKALSERFAAQVQSPSGTREENEQELGANITLKLRKVVNDDYNARKAVCWRIREIFPGIDDPTLVYWESETKFGIRLSMEELIKLFSIVMAAAFAPDQLQKLQESDRSSQVTNEPIPQQPKELEVAALTIAEPAPASLVELDEQDQAHVDELERQIAVLQAEKTKTLVRQNKAPVTQGKS